jgi:hypothetical protein
MKSANQQHSNNLPSEERGTLTRGKCMAAPMRTRMTNA